MLGPAWIKEVMRGLGPPWMGEQISEIDQWQQCYFISPCMVSLEVLIWCAQDFRNRIKNMVTIPFLVCKGYREHHLCTHIHPGDVTLRFIAESVALVVIVICWFMLIFDATFLANSNPKSISEAYKANKVNETMQMDASTRVFTLDGVNWIEDASLSSEISLKHFHTNTHTDKLHTHTHTVGS